MRRHQVFDALAHVLELTATPARGQRQMHPRGAGAPAGEILTNARQARAMALARDLIAVLGGSLALASEKGVGSTFTVTLPAS